MKIIFSRLFFFCLILFSGNTVFSQSIPIMPLSELKAGMKGKSITVFYGQKKEEFNVEILSIVYNSAPQQNMILAKFTGKNVERSGIAQGMSGSPVYINNKLIGAIAYTWPNLKEAIGGIQPIEQMLPVLKEPLIYPSLASKEGFKMKDLPDPSKDIRPIDIPLVINGFTKNAYDIATKKINNQGIQTIQGNAGGEQPTPTKKAPLRTKKASKLKNKRLEPGDAVGILLMRGDALASAIGTVTYVDHKDPNKVLIFGHPFQELGYIKLPMTKANVHYVMPSTEIAWKFASAQEIVGSVYNDRKTAVAGKIGVSPSLVPVNVSVMDSDQNQKTNFYYEIISDANFFPNLFAGAVVNSFTRFGSQIYQTVKMDLVLEIKNKTTKKLDKLVLSNYLAGNGEMISKGIAAIISQPLEQLFMNLYSEIEVLKVSVSIDTVSKIQVAEINQAIIGDTNSKPGEKAKVRIILNTYKNKKEMITLDVPIPLGYKEPVLPVTITGGLIAENNLQTLYTGIKEPKSYDQLLEYLSQQVSGNDLVIYYDIEGITANIDGYVLKNLPLSKAYDFGVKQQTNKYYGAVRHSFSFPTNYLVAGQVQLMIPVKN